MQDGKVEISERDITTNLPFVPGVHLAFDHHLSETFRSPGERPNHIIYPDAPSAARVVYEHYGGKSRFPASFNAMMLAVDKSDSANFTRQEILDPKDWVLLNYLMDSRTGLGRFREFRVSNYQLMMDLIAYCRTTASTTSWPCRTSRSASTSTSITPTRPRSRSGAAQGVQEPRGARPARERPSTPSIAS
jgi:nanoRNase/pAp phosphatase (c-di-AMP/oligoRNAs hydrolase)